MSLVGRPGFVSRQRKELFAATSRAAYLTVTWGSLPEGEFDHSTQCNA
jgi:hypothetical protein